MPNDCPDGRYCPQGSARPIDCPQQFYCNEMADLPEICPAGSYCSKRSAAPKQCTGGHYCSAGSYKQEGCPPGSFCVVGSMEPMTCPEAYYCHPHTEEPELCPEMHYCPEGAWNHIPCPSGEFCPAGSSKPLPCPMGMFCPGNGKPKPKGGPKSPKGSDTTRANLQSDSSEIVVLENNSEENSEGRIASMVIAEVNEEKADEQEHTLAIMLSSCALMVGVVGLMMTRSKDSTTKASKERISKEVFDQIVTQEEEGGAFLETHGQETSL